MTIQEFIQQATAEFEKNGRSRLFIAMENRIVKSAKPMQAYFFARYAKGASAERLQPIVLDNGTIEECYYFQRYVNGANIVPFVKRAIEESDTLVIDNFVQLAKETGKYAEIQDMLTEINYTKPTTNGKCIDINNIVENAKKEYELNGGRTAKYNRCEKIALSQYEMSANVLFAQCVPGANIRAFEHNALLSGDPFKMFFLATQVKESNKRLMLDGLELSKLDYVAIDRESEARNKRMEEITDILTRTKDSRDIKRLKDEYEILSTRCEYISKINGDYLPRVKYLVKQEELKKVRR